VIRQVPPRLAADFPALLKTVDTSEAPQLAGVAKVMGVLASRDEPAVIGEANPELARRISDDGEDAEYLVPGNEVLCMVVIAAGHGTGGGCAPVSSVEADGTTSLTVVPGGYEVSGILPIGTSSVSISTTTGQTTVVAANADHAFEFLSAVPLSKLVYSLPSGAQHTGSLDLPPPRDLPPPPTN
jgi:hypothetical protein